MYISYGLLLMTSVVLYLTPSTESTQCWICYQAGSYRDCIMKGFTMKCRSNEICESEIRYSGFKPVITKRCKQAQACMNDQYQNMQISNERSQCGPGRRNSVCRCCCNSYNCNKYQSTCNNIKKPKCRQLYLPNGYTRCYGTADRISPGTRCRFSCRTGYSVERDKFVSCRRLGTQAAWSGNVPKCKKMPTCARLLDRSFSNGIVRCYGRSRIATVGTTCVYKCKPRYSLVMNGKRKNTANYERTVCTMLNDMPTWSKRRPTCIAQLCPLATNLDHGFAKCTDSNQLGSVCTFTCLGGYDLVGPKTVTCVQKSGYKDWNGGIPTCRPKPCPINTFTKPSLTVECSHSNQFRSICTISCKRGQYLVELAKNPHGRTYTSTCRVRGDGVDWDLPAPTCVPKQCPRIRVSDGAEFQCTDGLNYMSKCTFSCRAPERVLVGQPVITCTDDGDQTKPDGSWSDNLPSCTLKKCPQLNVKATNVSCTNGLVYGSVCTFSCNSGYHMLASDGVNVVDSSQQPTTTTCSLQNNQVVWSNAPPKCERQRCEEILAGQSLIISCDDNEEIGSKCTFSCQSGYDLIGKRVTECTANDPNQILGKWSDSTPDCQRRSCANINRNGLSTDLECTNDFKYESVCTFVCKSGYFMAKDSTTIESVKAICMYVEGNMIWSETTPTCQPKQCIAIRNIVNGNRACSSELIVGATCQFSCDRGYDLIGTNFISCTDDGTLSDSGVWSSTAPTCEPRKCQTMGVDETTVEINCNNNNNNYKSVCSVQCKPQHFIRDAQGNTNTFSITTTCNIDNNDEMHWTPKPTSCEPVSCKTPEDSTLVSSCSDGNKTGSVCVFTCAAGYEVKGISTNRCVSIGQYNADWSRPMPTCIARRCDGHANDASMLRRCSNGNVYNSTCSFTCRRNRGLYMTSAVAEGSVIIESGTSESTCTVGVGNTVVWTQEKPICKVKSCAEPTHPANGRVRCIARNPHRYRARCTYNCDVGYGRVGPFIVICREGRRNAPEGTWSGRASCRRNRG